MYLSLIRCTSKPPALSAASINSSVVVLPAVGRMTPLAVCFGFLCRFSTLEHSVVTANPPRRLQIPLPLSLISLCLGTCDCPWTVSCLIIKLPPSASLYRFERTRPPLCYLRDSEVSRRARLMQSEALPLKHAKFLTSIGQVLEACSVYRLRHSRPCVKQLKILESGKSFDELTGCATLSAFRGSGTRSFWS